jgi:hypothetical protein
MMNNTPVESRHIRQAYNIGQIVDHCMTTSHQPVAEAVAQWLIDTPHGSETVLAIFPANTMVQIMERLADLSRGGKQKPSG